MSDLYRGVIVIRSPGAKGLVEGPNGDLWGGAVELTGKAYPHIAQAKAWVTIKRKEFKSKFLTGWVEKAVNWEPVE